MLTALVVTGSAIDRGTLPRAAWWRTMSTPSQARRQSSATRMSPSMNLNRDHCAGAKRRSDLVEIALVSGGEVVEPDDVLVQVEQRLEQVGADEAGDSRDEPPAR